MRTISSLLALPVALLLTAVFPALALAQCPIIINPSAQAQACAIRVSWQRDVNSGQAFNYTIFRAPADMPIAAVAIGTVSPSTFVFDDVPPLRSVSYAYTIRGNGLSGCPDNGPVSSPVVAALPGSIQRTSVNCQAPTLSWSGFSNVIGYVLIRSVNGGTPVVLTPSGTAATTYTDTTAPGNASLTYTVIANTACAPEAAATVTFTNAQAAILGTPPASLVVNSGATANFQFNITGFTTGSVSFGKDNQPFIGTIDPRISFSYPNQTLTITNVRPSDVGEYIFVVITLCGPVVQRAVLGVRNTCPTDFDQNGTRTVDDIFIFINAWFAGCP